MAPKDLLQPLSEASALAREGSIGNRVVREAAQLEADLGLVSSAEALGLRQQSQRVAGQVQEVEDAVRRWDVMLRRLVRAVEQTRIAQALREGKTVAQALRLLGPRRSPEVAELFEEVSQANRTELAARALKLMAERTADEVGRVLNNMAGQLREVIVKHLPEVRALVATETAALRRRLAGRTDLQLLDTGYHGDVELPGRMRGKDRVIRLGTDRLIGTGRLGDFAPGDEEFVVAGVFEVTMAIEVKGASNAVGGVEQLRRLQARAKPGYALIDGQFWLLRYERAGVTHVLVAPPGKRLGEAMAAAAKFKRAGARTQVVEIPASVDRDVIALARAYLVAAAGR